MGQVVPISFCIGFVDPPAQPVKVLRHSVWFFPASATVELDYEVVTSPCAGSLVPDTTHLSVRRPYRQVLDTLFIEHPYSTVGVPSTYVDTGRVVSATNLSIGTHLGPFTNRPGGPSEFQYRRLSTFPSNSLGAPPNTRLKLPAPGVLW
jgi:hypothetical protein